MEALNTYYPGESTFKLQLLVEESLHRFKLNKNCGEVSLYLIDDLVSPLSIKGNREQLQNVLDRLMLNAVTLGKASKIIVGLKQLLKTNYEVLLEFTVEDNGIKNNTIDGKSKFTYKRNLVEIKKSIEDFGGKTEVSSLEGVRTTVKFLAKFLWVEDLEVIETGLHNKLAGKKILVAEDNEINQKIIVHLLRKENIDVEVANDGKEAIELFEKKEYDLLLFDLQMPHMDGFQAAKYIRKILGSNIPIVAMTAGAYANEQTLCFEIGINQYLSKPFTSEELFQRLNYLLLNEHDFKSSKNSGSISTTDIYSLTSLRQSNEKYQVVEILEMFISKTPDLLKEIKEAVKSENIDSVIKKTAKLKGSLGSLQMHSMMKAVAEVEALVRMEEMQQISSAIEKLYKEYEVVIPLLRKELKRMKVKV